MTPTETRRLVDQLEVDHHAPGLDLTPTVTADGATVLEGRPGWDAALVHGEGVVLARSEGRVEWTEVYEHGRLAAAGPVELSS